MKNEKWGDFLRDCVSIVDYIQRYEPLNNIGGPNGKARTPQVTPATAGNV